jgi:hypothetical protein
MNKKMTALISIAVVTLVAGHTGYWIYQSGKIKSSIGAAAGQISKELGRKKAEFFFESSSVSGYPFTFTVHINQPKFISTGGGERLEVSSGTEQLVVISNLTGSSYVKHTIDEKADTYKLVFPKSAPQLEAKFSGNIMLGVNEATEFLPYLSSKLNSFRYSDTGYIVTSLEDAVKLASSDADVVHITKSRGNTNSISTSYNVKVQNLDGAALFADSSTPEEGTAKLWPVTANLDFSSIDTKDSSGQSSSVDFVVRDADVKAVSFAFNARGSIKANGNDIFPFGDLSLKINNYRNMVDYFSGAVSSAFAESKIPLFHIKSEKSINFKKVLYDISSEKSNEDKDILLNISREQGKSLFIGQKGLMEVIDLLKASAAVGVEPPAKNKDADATPGAPIINAAPAAGQPVVLPNK